MSFLSQQEHVSDGTLRVVPFSIAFLNITDLHFYIGADEVTTTVPVGGVLVQQITQYQVSLTAPVPAGVVFSVRRVTPRTSVPHIFNNGAALFNAANTDENNTYALLIVQEVYEQSGLGPFPGISTIDGTELLYVAVGGVRKQLTLATLLDQAPDVVLSTFKAELADQTDPLKGAGVVGDRGRTVHDALGDFATLAQFGAVGDGVADDRAAILLALASEKPLVWVGQSGNTFKLSSPISQTVDRDVIWHGDGATVTFAGTHAEYAISLNDAAGVQFILHDITINGAKLCNKVLEVLNNTSLSTASDFVANNLIVEGAKRISTLSGGEGIRIRGAFDRVVFNGGTVRNCELPAGQGTAGSIGIAGVSIDWYGTTSYVRNVFIDGLKVEKIYSSDLAYNDDQDGFMYFAPTSGTRKLPSKFTCVAAEFINCYGRSIKTQCRSTVVESSSFSKSEGLSRGFGNAEVDAQQGNGTFKSLSFNYSGGNSPGVCVNVSGSLGTPSLVVDDCEVVLDAATTLSSFAQVFPSAGTFSRHSIADSKVHGKVKEFFTYYANGDKNYAELSNNYVQEIVNGETGEKALVYVRASGASSPYLANITASGNIYGDTHLPALVRDFIPGLAVESQLSAWGNHGFATDTVSVNPQDALKTNPFAAIEKVGAVGGYGYQKVRDITIPGNGTLVVPVGNIQGALILVQMQYTPNSFAIFSSSGSANVGAAVGSDWALGNTSDPGSGTFRVWSSGTRELTFKNTDPSTRRGVMMILSPGT